MKHISTLKLTLIIFFNTRVKLKKDTNIVQRDIIISNLVVSLFLKAP